MGGKNKIIRCAETLKIGAFGAALCFLLCAFGGCSKPAEEPSTSASYPISLGVVRSDVRIIGTVKTFQDLPCAPECSLKCTSASGVRSLTSLDDLNGLVQIDSPSAALYFVRFRSSWSTYKFFPGNYTCEIVNAGELNQISGYGLLTNPAMGGGVGLMDDREFKRMGCAEATVKMIAGQYVVTRWLLLHENGTGAQYVEKVRETVGEAGNYSLAVISKKDVSDYIAAQQGLNPWLFEPGTCL